MKEKKKIVEQGLMNENLSEIRERENIYILVAS